MIRRRSDGRQSYSPPNNSDSGAMSSSSSLRESTVNDGGGGDDDDDLRSLLSGNSLGEGYSNPHATRMQSHNKQDAGGGEGGGNVDSASAAFVRSGSSGSAGGGGNRGASSAKRALAVLGAVVLALGLVGPSVFWDDEGGDGSGSGGHFAMAQRYHGHGDKHHHLPPPGSVSWADRATTTISGGRHGKFGTIRDRKKERRERKRREKRAAARGDGGGKKGRGGRAGGIREAIHNIDKVFLDNTRPQTVVAKEGQRGQRGSDRDEDDALLLGDDDDVDAVNPIPVIHYADGDAESARLDANADALDAYTSSRMPASDALECRASVVAFVINATDVKDECDGLRKAFDKTCSVHHSTAVAQGAAVEGHEHRRHGEGGSRTRRGRRRLSEWGRPRLWDLIPDAYRRRAKSAIQGGAIAPGVRRGGRRLLLAFGRRERDDIDDDGGGRRLLGINNNRTLLEIDRDSGGGERRVEEQQHVEQQSPPLISLNIPTAEKHISEDVLNDALLLQASSDPGPARVKRPSSESADSADGGRASKVPAAEAAQVPEEDGGGNGHTGESDQDVPSHNEEDEGAAAVNTLPTMAAIPNNPDITAESNEAVQDAAESAHAIRAAVDSVKNSMSDPKSVEARTCCASILSVFHEHCDPTTTGVEDYSDRRLLIVVFVITVCGIVKSLIRHLDIRWLPEAGGCILVGVFGYLILEHLPHVQFAFDGDMFLRIMVPPIVFEAAVKINKQSFRRHIVPICIFSIVGTLASTAFTALLLHKGSGWSSYATTIPMKESLIFGSLISSIDPIAVLSVLNNMGMNDTDTIYVLIFGESLLNDGVAIVLFQTLVHFLDESLVIDSDVLMDAFMHFVVVALGSVTVGMLSGGCATVYFALMNGVQTPMVEVIMFCCWSFIPYYICDMVEWSGIVAIVANGFVMDLFVIGQKHHQQHNANGSVVDEEIDFLVNGGGSNGSRSRHNQPLQCRSSFNFEGHLSSMAERHVHFVIEIFATLMETAIFAYLGLFLFSPRYHWSRSLTVISIFATVMGRIIMVPLFSQVANIINRMTLSKRRNSSTNVSAQLCNNNEGVHIDRRMQTVLIFAGLRGAMSFALVEHIPMFDTTTGEGSRLKPELKAMTSASVIFTVFVLGGATSYLMERLGYVLNKQPADQHDTLEIAPLVRGKRSSPAAKRTGKFSLDTNQRNTASSVSTVRQRGAR